MAGGHELVVRAAPTDGFFDPGQRCYAPAGMKDGSETQVRTVDGGVGVGFPLGTVLPFLVSAPTRPSAASEVLRR